MNYTIGEGLTNPVGYSVQIPDLLAFLERDTGMGDERWIATHEYVGAYRKTENWVGSSAVPVDLDFRATGEDGRAKKVSSDGWADELEAAWESGALAGTAFWRTPHGVRILYVFTEMLRDADLFGRCADAVGEAAAKVVRAIVNVDVVVDPGMRQVGRLIYMPRTKVKGEKRSGKVLGHRDEAGEQHTFTPDQLLAMAPPPVQVPPPPAPGEQPRTIEAVAELSEARAKYNDRVGSERLGIPGLGADFETADRWCPVCNHSDCFGPAMRGKAKIRGRWVCRSTNHFKDTPYADKGVKCGTKTTNGEATGDTLDLACWHAAQGQADMLMKAGFLRPADIPLPPSVTGRAQIFVPKDGTNNFTSSVDFVRQALNAAPEGGIYRWAGTVSVLARVDGRISMRPLSNVGMALLANNWADFHTERVTQGVAQKPRVNLDATHGAMLAEAAQTHERVRELRGVIEYPAVGADGAILEAGWNEGSGMWYEAPKELEGLKPAVEMTREEAAAWLRGFLEDFCDVLDAEAMANAVGLIVTAFMRPALLWHPVPLHAALSPMEGSGKSILCEAFVGEAVTGRPSANLHLYDDQDELAKTLFAYAQSGANCVVIDNVRGGTTVDDNGLASAITRPTFTARVLGQSQMRVLDNLFVPMLTGNNVSFSREMTRRTVPIQFRPKQVLQQRKFRHDAHAWVRQNRKRLAEVVLGAVARAARDNPQGFPGRTYVGFDRWSVLVGGVVYQLGQDAWLAGLLDWHSGETSNPELAAMRSFCAAWDGHKLLRRKDGGCRASDLWTLIEDDPSALNLSGSTDQRRMVSLGIKLTEMVGRVDLTPYVVRHAGTKGGVKYYELAMREPGEEG